MAQKKITELDAAAGVTDDDLLAIVDDPGGTPVTKKVTVANAKSGLLASHVLLSAAHSDSLADTVVRGDIIIGNSTPAWARLAKGAAYTVLYCDGTDVAWSAAPRLANIADTDGTNRITLATTAPFFYVTGTAKFSGAIGIMGSTITSDTVGVLATPIISGPWTGVWIGPSITFTGTNNSFTGLFGNASVGCTTGSLTGMVVKGLNFGLVGSTTSVSSTYGSIIGCQVRISATAISSGTNTVTLMQGYYLQKSAFTTNGTAIIAVGEYDMIDLRDPATNKITNLYGIKIDNCSTATTINRILELGPTPYLRLVGGWTAAANLTPLYLAEGVTPTLRQLTTFNPGAAGINFTNGQLVCVLV